LRCSRHVSGETEEYHKNSFGVLTEIRGGTLRNRSQAFPLEPIAAAAAVVVAVVVVEEE
jgi:hypothetical protein